MEVITALEEAYRQLSKLDHSHRRRLYGLRLIETAIAYIKVFVLSDEASYIEAPEASAAKYMDEF